MHLALRVCGRQHRSFKMNFLLSQFSFRSFFETSIFWTLDSTLKHQGKYEFTRESLWLTHTTGRLLTDRAVDLNRPFRAREIVLDAFPVEYLLNRWMKNAINWDRFHQQSQPRQGQTAILIQRIKWDRAFRDDLYQLFERWKNYTKRMLPPTMFVSYGQSSERVMNKFVPYLKAPVTLIKFRKNNY